jgi:hypothetical protein
MRDVKGKIACALHDSILLCDCNVLPARDTPHVYSSINLSHSHSFLSLALLIALHGRFRCISSTSLSLHFVLPSFYSSISLAGNTAASIS